MRILSILWKTVLSILRNISLGVGLLLVLMFIYTLPITLPSLIAWLVNQGLETFAVDQDLVSWFVGAAFLVVLVGLQAVCGCDFDKICDKIFPSKKKGSSV